MFIYFWLCWVFVAARGLFYSCGEQGLLFVAVHRLLIAVASRCRAQALGAQASVVVARRLSSCGSRALERRLSSCGARAYLLCGMWDLPGPGLKPVSSALAGRFSITAPPAKPTLTVLRRTAHILCRISLTWNLFLFFFNLRFHVIFMYLKSNSAQGKVSLYC